MTDGREQPGTTDGDRELTIGEAALRFGVSQKTIRRWIKAGRLHAVLEEGRFGPQYRVLLPTEPTVGADGPISPDAIAAAVAARLDERQSLLQQDLACLRDQVADLTRAVETLAQTLPGAQPSAALAPDRPRWRLLGAR